MSNSGHEEPTEAWLAERLASAEQLIVEIHQAFPAKRDPQIGPLSDGGLREEPLATARAFADKTDWTLINYEWLDEAPDGWGSARSFFSPAAACFYLPAYLMADIHFKMLKIGGPVFELTLGFGTPDHPSNRGWRSRTAERWSGLTPEQVKAIVQYLEWAARLDEFDAEQIQPALAEYWYPRLLQSETR